MRGNGKIYTVVYSQVSSATSRHDWRTLSWSHSRWIRKPFVSDLLLGGLFKIGTHVIKNVSDNIRYFGFYIYIYIWYINIYIYYTYVTYIYIHLYAGQWFLGTPSSRTRHGSLCEAFVNESRPGWGCAGPALAGASTTAVNTQADMRPADFEQLWPYGYIINIIMIVIIIVIIILIIIVIIIIVIIIIIIIIIGIFPIQWQFEERKVRCLKIEVILWWRQIWSDHLCRVSTSTLAVRGRLQATLRRTSPTGPPRGRLTSMSCSSSSHILDSRVGLSWKYCKLSQY